MIRPAQWLTELRKRKRFVLYALLPLFGWSAAFGAGCSAMPLPPAAATASHTPTHDHAAAHSVHEHGDTAAADELDTPARVCPHCALETGNTASGHAVCGVTDSNERRHVAPVQDTNERAPPLLALTWRLPVARAAPALTHRLPSAVAPLAATVPLIVIHCVLLI